MICPVALALIAASALFALATIVLFWRDPHRRLTGRALVRALAELPAGRAVAVLTVAAGGGVALMFALDGSGAPGFAACALIAFLLVACSAIAAVLSIVAGRVMLAFGQRLLLAIVAAISAAAVTARRRRSAAFLSLPLLTAAPFSPRAAACAPLRSPSGSPTPRSGAYNVRLTEIQ